MSDWKEQEDVLLLDREETFPDDNDLIVNDDPVSDSLFAAGPAAIEGEKAAEDDVLIGDDIAGADDVVLNEDNIAADADDENSVEFPGNGNVGDNRRESARGIGHDGDSGDFIVDANDEAGGLAAAEEESAEWSGTVPEEESADENGTLPEGESVEWSGALTEEESADGNGVLTGEGTGIPKETSGGKEAASQTKAVVGVRFRSVGKSYYFAVGNLPVKRGSHVIVETARGLDYGTSICDPMELDRKQFKAPVKRIVRLATAADENRILENRGKEYEAYRICYEKIRRRELDMKLIQAEYAFDGSKILFYFTADERVDFRDLVKDLAGVFHTRIELRQIGVRDETRILGGCGICGRPLCCHTYLTDFAPVSIKMAKEQNLSLNPAKISGTCGRLMCCLKNEEEVYEELNKNLPRPGDEVEGSDGLTGEVAGVDILRQLVRILVEVDDEKELHEYPADEITILRRRKRGQAKPKINRSELRDPKNVRRGAAAGVAGQAQDQEQGAPASGAGSAERREGTDGRNAGRRSPAAERVVSEPSVHAADDGEQVPPVRSERAERRSRQDNRADRSARAARMDRTGRSGQEGTRTDRTAHGRQEGNRADRSNERPEDETVSNRRDSAEHTDRRNVRAEGPVDHAQSDTLQPGEPGSVNTNSRRRNRSRSNAARTDRASKTRGENVRSGDFRWDGPQGQEISAAGAGSPEGVIPQGAAGADLPEKAASQEAAGRSENASSRVRHRRNRRRSGTGNGTGVDPAGGSAGASGDDTRSADAAGAQNRGAETIS